MRRGCSIETALERFESKIERIPFSGCWIWMAADNETQYGRFGMPHGTEFAHRAAWMLFVGRIPVGMRVLHRCDVRPCVNPYHLFIGTAKDNSQDASAKGRIIMPPASYASSEDHQNSKLTNAQVVDIRASSERSDQLAIHYGVSYECIWRARTRRTYRDVP